MLFASSVYWWTGSTEELTEQMLRIIPSVNFSTTSRKVLDKLQTCIRYNQCNGNCSMQNFDVLSCLSNSKLRLADAPFPISISMGYYWRQGWRRWQRCYILFIYLFIWQEKCSWSEFSWDIYGCNGAKFKRPRRQMAWHNKEKWPQ